MSRAYRICVSETLRRVVSAADHVESDLQLLEIVSRAETAEILDRELDRRGYQKAGELRKQSTADVEIAINPATGRIRIDARDEQDLELEEQREGRYYDDVGLNRQQTEQKLRAQIQRNLQKQADQSGEDLQRRTTERLERALSALQEELDEIAHAVAAEALKRKAARIGRVKSIDENKQNGDLTIVVEV